MPQGTFRMTSRWKGMTGELEQKAKKEVPGSWAPHCSSGMGPRAALSFQLRDTSLCGQHRKKQTVGAGEITGRKILDTGNRLPELTAKQQFYFCSSSLACSHSQTVPKCPWGKRLCVGGKFPLWCFAVVSFYFEMISDFQKRCKDSTEPSRTPLLEIPLLFISYLTPVHLSKLRDWHWCNLIN